MLGQKLLNIMSICKKQADLERLGLLFELHPEYLSLYYLHLLEQR